MHDRRSSVGSSCGGKIITGQFGLLQQYRPRTDFMQCSKKQPYSITSSAVASSVGGTVRPKALAVFRLMTNSNLVGCTTGRSPGLSPLRIRPSLPKSALARSPSRALEMLFYQMRSRTRVRRQGRHRCDHEIYRIWPRCSWLSDASPMCNVLGKDRIAFVNDTADKTFDNTSHWAVALQHP